MKSAITPPARVRALLFTFISTTSLVFALLTTNQWFVGLVTGSAAGNTITVNSTSDVVNNADGLCTLREAIVAVNTNTASGAVAGECVAGNSSGSDAVDLTGLTGSITVASLLPDLSSDMTLTGPGAGTLTVSRSTSTSWMFFISSNATVSISGLSLQGGASDTNTGIANLGILNLTDCKVSGFGKGLSNGLKTLTISNCVVSGNVNGGGISVGSGTVNLIDSEVNDNDSHGAFGPGIDNSFGRLNVTNSTIKGNKGHFAIMNGATATFINSVVSNNVDGGFLNNGTLSMTGGSVTGNTNFGGLLSAGVAVISGVTVSNNSNMGWVFSGGGGIFLGGTSATVINCLVTNNSASGHGGGIHNAGGKVTVINTTISNNTTFSGGGGVAVSGPASDFTGINLTITGNRSNLGGGAFRESTPMKFRNSLIAGNFQFNGTTPSDIGSPVDVSSSFNLIGVGGSGGLTNGVNNNLVGVADPRLGPLANNGGPTQTYSLLSDSPALDAGDNCVTEVTHCGEPTVPQVTTDQRGAGFNRIVDGPDANTTAIVDIGAYETQLPLASLANTTTNEDKQLVVPFDAGDAGTITSITATSSNSTLVPNDSAHLSAALAGTTGVITINPSADLFGASDVTVTVNRTGGTEVKTFTLTVNSSNDAPSFTKGLDQTVNEDAGAQTVENWATNLLTGPADEAGETLTFQVTANTNAALFSVGPAISSTGTLTYTPALNANGTATVTIALKDSGGIANGGIDTSSTQIFIITINPVNDAPTFNKGPDLIVNEDSGLQFVSWATNVSTGAPNEFQALTSQVIENTNPNLFSSAPAIGFNGTLGFAPAPNASGSATITIVLKDNGGIANGGADTSAPKTFTITVRSVNDRPSFTPGPTQFVSEDSGPQTIANWATDFSVGPADEAQQTLSITLTNSNNDLFSAQPALGATGTLTYTPAPNANGFATVTVTLKDDGGTANGGQDALSQIFFIVVSEINDAPVNTVPGPQSVIKNSLLFFSATESNQISIADVDGGNAARQVTLIADNGVITLNRTMGLSFSDGNGTANSKMRFTGTIININAALNGMRFTPTNDFTGHAQLQIETNDLGNTGTGGALSDSDTVNITVVDGSALQFSVPSYAVVEGSELVTITVTRIGSGGTASVNYSTSNGTATGGVSCGSGIDYVTTSGTLSWATGETNAKTFTVAICEDAVNEPDETVNLSLSAVTGEASLGSPRIAVLTIADAGPPVLLTEENTDHAIALDLVTLTRDPFSLTNPFNLSTDHRRRISLFIWKLALRPTDTASDVIVVAEDEQGKTYPLTVEYVGAVADVPLVSQVVVRLPEEVIGAPRDLRVTIQLRGTATNKGVIKIGVP
ncbi:MAG TPA: choice-of-anchor Q domain-containing protein [Pyrinomonadaceae bacterium]|nr:choice-of-anchor Q domain-containing protein [Pyrinomonadaceae bacterium]